MYVTEIILELYFAYAIVVCRRPQAINPAPPSDSRCGTAVIHARRGALAHVSRERLWKNSQPIFTVHTQQTPVCFLATSHNRSSYTNVAVELHRLPAGVTTFLSSASPTLRRFGSDAPWRPCDWFLDLVVREHRHNYLKLTNLHLDAEKIEKITSPFSKNVPEIRVTKLVKIHHD